MHGENCPRCKIEVEASGAIKQVDNPVYPCYLKHSYEGTMKYFMAKGMRCWRADWDKYISKQDKNLAIIQQIFIKIDHVYPNGRHHPNSVVRTDLFRSVVESLAEMRSIVWFQSLRANTEEEIDIYSSMEINRKSQDVLIPLLTSIIESHQAMTQYEMNDREYKWWTSFIFFLNLFFHANFFYENMYDLQFINEENFDASEETLELKDHVFRSNFLEMWSKLLDMAVNKMVPFEELLQIYCAGQLSRKCGDCSRKIKVVTFLPYFLITAMQGLIGNTDLMREFDASWTKGQSYVLNATKIHFSCGKNNNRCTSNKDEVMMRCHRLIECTVLFSASLSQRLSTNRCHCCYRVTESVHRCSSCKVKVYCSEECQHEDWTVHNLCCEDLSKMKVHQAKGKGGAARRKRIGIEKMKKWNEMEIFDIPK